MDFRKLEIFVRVAQLKNFSQAARELHMAQPAVSIAIRKLEEALDTRLFDRSGRQVELTAEGHNLLDKARGILRDVDELVDSVSAMNTLLKGELTIACPSMLATYFLPNLLSRFLTLHPGLKASVTQAGTTRVEQMILQDEIELGVTTSAGDTGDGDLELIPLVTEEMVLCVADGHQWSKRHSIHISELHESPMIVYDSGYFIRSTLDRMCADHGIKPDFRMQTNFLPLLIKMLKEGMGSTVGLKMMGEGEPGISSIALEPTTEVRMALTKRRGRTISKANQAFMDWAGFKL
ncbi:MAG: LysR family transcriptional regulator [Halioglobus sp.]